jgi:hypothetical protein
MRISRLVMLKSVDETSGDDSTPSKPYLMEHDTYIILPPFLFICRWIVQFYTIQRQIKRNGGGINIGLSPPQTYENITVHE